MGHQPDEGLQRKARQPVKCIDCGEPITEADRKNARSCRLCKQLMHPECSMAGADEEDLCEGCFFEQKATMAKAMKAMGVEP